MEVNYLMETRFVQMMLSAQRCVNASRTLYEQLKSDIRLKSIVIFKPHTGDICFQVKFIKPNGKISGIYISHQIDVNGYGYEYDGSETAECTLIDCEDNLCFIDKLGYKNSRKFNSANELVEEILRVFVAKY